MKKSDWKDIAELVGMAAIVVSLIFLALQIRQQQLLAETEAYGTQAAQLSETTQVINENRDIWVKGLKGEELSEVDKSIFYGLAYAQFVRTVYLDQRNRRLNVGTANRQAELFALEIYTYPGLRRWWEYFSAKRLDSRALFDRDPVGPATTRFTVQEALTEIDRRSPPIPDNKSYNIE